MLERIPWLLSLALVLATLSALACGDDSTEADRLGVGSDCAGNTDCDESIGLVCLDQFKGGYCGLQDCQADSDCPEASACIAHTDGSNYCFRVCVDKVECNLHRGVDVESNCSSNVDFVDGAMGRKACVPPSN